MRYILFGGDIYYARGGFRDYILGSNDADQLRHKVTTMIKDIDWWHIVDTETREIIAESEDQACA